MKTTIFGISLIGLTSLFSSFVLAQGWVQLSDFPSSARDDGSSFSIGSITYCGTGLDGTWNPTNDFFAFDMNTDTWNQISGLPATEARQYSNGFSLNGNGFIFGGITSAGYQNDLWKYDPISDSWTELSPLPAAGRSGASCFVLGDTAYILGGQTQTSSGIDEVWAYSIPSDSWTQKSAMPHPLWRASSTDYQGKGYLIFGVDNGDYKNDFFEYSPTTDTWTSLSNFPGVGRTYVGMSVLNDEIVLFAGRDSIGNSYNDMWRYSTLSDSWSLGVNLPSDQRRGGMCFSSNTSLYYTTGINLNNVRLTETWKYDLFLELGDGSSDQFSIYPNPINDFVKIKGPNTSGMIDYQIISVDGGVVLSGTTEIDHKIPLEDVKSGHYILVLRSQSNTSFNKIVIF